MYNFHHVFLQRHVLLLLPCRERGSKTTKAWLRKLQRYLHYTKASYDDDDVAFKLVTVFTCRARQILAGISPESMRGLAGVVSFEPRPMAGVEQEEEGDVPPVGSGGGKKVEYCDTRALNTMQLARLGKRLAVKHGGKKMSIVYTYRWGYLFSNRYVLDEVSSI